MKNNLKKWTLVVALSTLVFVLVSSGVLGTVTSSSPVSVYTMDNFDGTNSISGKVNLTKTGAFTNVTSCINNGCLNATSTSSYLYSDSYSDIGSSTNKWSVSFWMNIRNYDQYDNPYTIAGAGSNLTFCEFDLLGTPAGGRLDCNSNGAYATFSPVSGIYNTWTHFVVTSNGTETAIYVNGVLSASALGSFSLSSGKLYMFTYSSPTTRVINGMIDEFYVFNYNLSREDIGQLSNTSRSDLAFYPFVSGIVTQNITFVSQVPSDINSGTLFSARVNLSYNYTLNNPNMSNPYINYSVSLNNSCLVNINGSCDVLANTFYPTNYTSNSTSGNNSVFVKTLGENNIYPLRQNFVNTSTVSSITLSNNGVFADEILNLTTSTPFGVYELPITITGIAQAKIYYYNSSYSFSSSILTNPNIVEIATLTNSTPINHSHGLYNHTLVPYFISNGKIGNVAVNGGGFLIYKPSSAGTVTLTSINSSVRINSGRSSSNSGLTWTASNTLASHTHMFDSNTTLSYKACGTFGSTLYCSSLRNEVIEVIQYAPQPPIITIPFGETNYTRYINITWLNATPTSPNTNISFYGLALRDENNTPISSIDGIINSTTNYYYWDTYAYNLTVNKTYYVRVTATDTNGLTSHDTESFQVQKNTLLNFSVFSWNGSIINNFTYTIEGVSVNVLNNSSFTHDVIYGNNYSVRIVSPGYSSNISNFSISSKVNYFANTTLYLYNSLYMDTYVDDLNHPLYSANTSILLDSGGALRYTATTNSTGSAILSSIVPGTYTLTYSNPSYPTKQVVVTIVDDTYTFLPLIFSTGGDILFNFKDTGGNTLPGVYCLEYHFSNSSFVLGQSAFADVSGRIQFNLKANTFYSFNCTLLGYVPYNFNLNPIYFTSYTITMKSISTGNNTPTGYVVFSPLYFYNGQNSTFNISFVSPFGNFISYNFTFTYNGFTTTGTGIIDGGSSFSVPFFMPGDTTPRYVVLNYSFMLDDGTNFSKSISWLSIVPFQNKTLVNMGSKQYDLRLGDRVFAVILLMIPFMGVLNLGGGLTSALLGGGFIIYVFSNNGFLGVSGASLFSISVTVILIYLLLRAWYSR